MLSSFFRLMPPCIFHRMTGFYCPGCGGTRSVLALLGGHMIKSLYYHPIVLYTAVCFSWYFIKLIIQKASGGKITLYMPRYTILLNTAAALVILNWLLRNLLLIGWGITLPQ